VASSQLIIFLGEKEFR